MTGARRIKDAHLMVDEELLEKIVGYAEIKKGEKVLEVGAGTGNLTEKLLDAGAAVCAVEKDADLCDVLEERFGGEKGFTLISGDATKIKLPKFDKTVSNVPYSISRKLTLKLLPAGFVTGVFVFQKEFAQKLAASPDRENYRMVSALAQSTCEIGLLDMIPPTAFDPPPNVWSHIVKLKPENKVDTCYIKFLNDLFNHRKKKMGNTLEGLSDEYKNKRLHEVTPQDLLKMYCNNI